MVARSLRRELARHHFPKAQTILADAVLLRPEARVHRPHPKHAFRRLDLVTSTLSGDERARECGIGEVDRDGVVENPAHPGGVIAQPSAPQFSSSQAVIWA